MDVVKTSHESITKDPIIVIYINEAWYALQSVVVYDIVFRKNIKPIASNKKLKAGQFRNVVTVEEVWASVLPLIIVVIDFESRA